MKVGDSIKKRTNELNNLPDEDLKNLADALLEDAKNQTSVPTIGNNRCHLLPDELIKRIDELYEETRIKETEIFKMLPVQYRFEKDLL